MVSTPLQRRNGITRESWPGRDVPLNVFRRYFAKLAGTAIDIACAGW
jgi:hypothetical protein